MLSLEIRIVSRIFELLNYVAVCMKFEDLYNNRWQLELLNIENMPFIYCAKTCTS